MSEREPGQRQRRAGAAPARPWPPRGGTSPTARRAQPQRRALGRRRRQRLPLRAVSLRPSAPRWLRDEELRQRSRSSACSTTSDQHHDVAAPAVAQQQVDHRRGERGRRRVMNSRNAAPADERDRAGRADSPPPCRSRLPSSDGHRQQRSRDRRARRRPAPCRARFAESAAAGSRTTLPLSRVGSTIGPSSVSASTRNSQVAEHLHRHQRSTRWRCRSRR